MATVIQPRGWPRPRGYANGMVASGRLLAIAGQIGIKYRITPTPEPADDDAPPDATMAHGFVAQFAQAVDNVIDVVRSAGGHPTHIVALTIFVTDQRQYLTATGEVGEVWRARFGDHYPAMALVEVKGLLEPDALLEIQGLAVLP